jgi:hypothetical protein
MQTAVAVVFAPRCRKRSKTPPWPTWSLSWGAIADPLELVSSSTTPRLKSPLSWSERSNPVTPYMRKRDGSLFGRDKSSSRQNRIHLSVGVLIAHGAQLSLQKSRPMRNQLNYATLFAQSLTYSNIDSDPFYLFFKILAAPFLALPHVKS